MAHERASTGGRGATFRRRLFLWMLLVALVPLGLVSWQGWHGAREALVDAARDQVRTLVGSRRSQILAWLAERANDLEVVSRSRECVGHVTRGPAADADHHQVCQYLETFRLRTHSYQSISLYDLRWRWVAGTAGDSPATAEQISPYLRASLEKGARQVVTPVHPLKRGGEIGLAMGTRLVGPEDRAVGYVVAALNLSRTLGPLLAERTGLGRSGTVYLVGEGGRFLSPPRPGEGSRVLGLAPAGRWEGEEGTAFYRDHRGREVIGGHARLAGTDWTVVAEIELAEALGLLAVLQRRALLVALVTLLVVLAVSLLVSRKLAAPLRALADVSRRISSGRYDERVAIRDGREAGEVGQAFNQMLDDLAASRDSLARTAALAAVGEISARVVHEMRNPLSSVKMNLQALSRKVEGDPAYGELAGIAREQVARLERMLGDLLGYGKPLALEPREVRAAEVLAGASRLAAGERERSGAGVETLDRTAGASFRGDPALLSEALSNLLTNALQSAGPGGRVVVRALPDGADGAGVVFEVSDSGPGVEAAAREQLFRPFFTTRREGTGLGLAIVRKVVELHGGTVALTGPGGLSGGGPGATFRVRLPRRGPR